MKIQLGWLPLLLVGCGLGEALEETPEEHACAEALEGLGTAVDAAVDAASAGSEVAVGMEASQVSLIDQGGGVYGGAVGFSVDEYTDALLFVDTKAVVRELVHEGVPQSLATPTPSELCPEDLPAHWDLGLEPGVWAIEFGPAAVETVWVLLIAAAGHDDEAD